MRPALSDEQLLTSDDPEAFGVFYARHLVNVERYFAVRLGDRESARDLASETFASALVARRRFAPGPAPAVGWLYTIAARRLIDFRRRAAVERRRGEAFAAEAFAAEAGPVEPVPAADARAGMLRHLPAEQREAVAAHVIDGYDYNELALRLEVSEASVRQRVSRGLRSLRLPLEVYRAAQQVAREDRGYRLGGGHFRPIAGIARRDPLDCSSAASLILARAGVFDGDEAWVAGRIAKAWGRPGEGRHVTVWANEQQVWIEFRLDADHTERFDPTPSRLAPHSGPLTSTTRSTSEMTPRHWHGL